ncbi:hypothetical protein [Henriciella aquimarina]|uniref:hypothetical protein n=1 Tax=Henriciella aquimarina TaxID=545261 RepID=UPI000A06BE67|nr:hypothetical protein [Henriciella aquimarina]
MLFLLNDHIVDVEMPEMHLERRWQSLGCGAPHAFMAQDVVDFVHARLDEARISQRAIGYQEARDLAALIIARTGANSFILRMRPNGSTFPMLRAIPVYVLEVFARGVSHEGDEAADRPGGALSALQ